MRHRVIDVFPVNEYVSLSPPLFRMRAGIRTTTSSSRAVLFTSLRRRLVHSFSRLVASIARDSEKSIRHRAVVVVVAHVTTTGKHTRRARVRFPRPGELLVKAGKCDRRLELARAVPLALNPTPVPPPRRRDHLDRAHPDNFR